MNHYIQDNIYTIVSDDGDPIFQLALNLNLPNNQVVIETNNEVYAGPLQFLHFKEE